MSTYLDIQSQIKATEDQLEAQRRQLEQSARAQLEALQKQAEQVRSQEIAGVVQDIVAKMQSYGITLQDLKAAGVRDASAKGRGRGAAGRKAKVVSKNPAPIKFRGPNGEEWSGRGLTPKWLSALIAQGQSKESFAV
jgi:DNA-binding protein H-NS